MKFTTVKSTQKDLKFPTSTLGDPKVFEFVNVEVYGPSEISRLFQKEFVLNYPLKHSVQSRRNSQSIGPFLEDYSNYMIVDFNDVPDKESRNILLERFKSFTHVAFKTRGADDIFSFNFRIILATPPTHISKHAETLKKLSKKIHPSLGKINLTTYRKAQITAAGHNGIISIQENGHLFNMDEFGHQMFWEYTKDIKFETSKLFGELGFKLEFDLGRSCGYSNPGTHNGNFMWFESNPFILVNEVSGETVDILPEFKRRFKVEDFRKSTSIKEILETPKIKRKIERFSFSAPSVGGELIDEKIKEAIRESKCLVIKSPMGSGKTKAIREMATKSQNCLIVTPRVSLADELYGRLKSDGAKVYHLHKIDPKNPGIFICQFDSLFKIDLKQCQFQTIIFDEFMTLCDHISSSVANNKEYNISKMVTLMERSQTLMLVDAFMEDISLDLIPAKFHKVDWVSNFYKDQCNLVLHKEIGSFLKSLLIKRSGGIVVSCVSVPAGMAIKNFLESQGMQVGMINADTSLEARNEIIKNYKERVLSAVIFTPSVSVGVNLLGLSGNQFHYDPGNVIPVIQSLQMTRRGRNCANVECFIKKTGKGFVPCLDEEKFRVMVDSVPGAVIFNEDGDRILTPVGKFLATLKFHNKIWNVDSNKSFARLANQNFSLVTLLDSHLRLGITLRNPANAKDITAYQPLSVFGAKAARLEESLDPQEVEDFIKFERFHRVATKSEGWEICRESIIHDAVFSFSKKIEIFEKCIDGMPLKDYNSLNVKLPPSWVEDSGMFWGKRVSLNKKFIDLCNFLRDR